MTRFTLDNGLRVVHSYDPATPMMALDIIYDVGARDESPDLTGMAHLFEHLMFGGSANIPDFDHRIELAGGWNNAWTSNDFTNFYSVVPAVNAETAFWLESDRMLSLAFSDKALEVQRSVVIEEFKQTCLNTPYGDLFHHLRPMLYHVHPYRYPVIGKEIAHIEKVTQEDVRNFFHSHYAPNNAVLAVSGNITAEETLRLAQKWFGPIPRREIAPRLYGREPRRDEPSFARVEGRVPQTLLTVAFPMPGYAEKGYEECDTMTDILSWGRSARFHQNLVMKDPLFTRADASILGSEEPGALLLCGWLSRDDDSSVEEARKLLVGQAEALASDLTDHELQRAINRFESNRTFDSLSYLSKANNMAIAELHSEEPDDAVKRRREVTVDSLKSAVADVIDPSRAATLVYSPAS